MRSNGFSFEIDFSHNKTFKRRKSLHLPHANSANILTQYGLSSRKRPTPVPSNHLVLIFWVVTYLLHATCYFFQTTKEPYQWFPCVLDCRDSPQSGETLSWILCGILPLANGRHHNRILDRVSQVHMSNGYLLFWYLDERSTPWSNKMIFFFC